MRFLLVIAIICSFSILAEGQSFSDATNSSGTSIFKTAPTDAPTATIDIEGNTFDVYTSKSGAKFLWIPGSNGEYRFYISTDTGLTNDKGEKVYVNKAGTSYHVLRSNGKGGVKRVKQDKS